MQNCNMAPITDSHDNQSSSSICGIQPATYYLPEEESRRKLTYESIKKLASAQTQIWKAQSKNREGMIKIYRYEYMTQCYEVLLRLGMLNKLKEWMRLEQLSQILKGKVRLIEEILTNHLSSKFYDYRFHEIGYNKLWLKVLEEVWNQFYTLNYEILEIMLNCTERDLKRKIIQILEESWEDSSSSITTPLFSSDSEIEEKVKIMRPNKKYARKGIKDFLSNQAIEEMEERILELNTKQWKEKLVSDLWTVFRKKGWPNDSKEREKIGKLGYMQTSQSLKIL